MIEQIEKLNSTRVGKGYCLCKEEQVDAANELLGKAVLEPGGYWIALDDEDASKLLESLREKYLDELSVADVQRIDRVLKK